MPSMMHPRDDLHPELEPPGDLGLQNPSIYIVHISSLGHIVPIEDQNDEPGSLLPDQGATTMVNGHSTSVAANGGAVGHLAGVATSDHAGGHSAGVDTSGIDIGHSARVSANGVAGGPAGVAASGLDGGQPADHLMLKANDTQKHVNPYHASSSGLSSTSMELCARGNSGEGISPESMRELESRGYPQDAIEAVTDNLLIGTELSQLKVENKRMRDQLTCKICRCREACIAFVPCRHIRLCDVCCRSAARCDKCHAAIETWMPIRPDGVCYP